SEWISDKTRFAFDGLKRQRLTYPLIKLKNSFKIISWKVLLLYLKTIFNKVQANEIKGYIGQLIDSETSLLFKDFFNRFGSSKLILESNTRTLINCDFRFNYLFNTLINNKSSISNSLNKSDLLFL